LRNQCVEEISAIEAGLARLRPAAAPLPDSLRCASAGAEQASREGVDIAPAAGQQQDVVAARADDCATSDDGVDDPATSAVSRAQDSLAVRPDTPDPALIAGSVLAAALARRTEPAGTNLAAELVKLQQRLTTRLKG